MHTMTDQEFDAKLADYREYAREKRPTWTDKQFQLACEQAADDQCKSENFDEDFFVLLCDFIDGELDPTYF